MYYENITANQSSSFQKLLVNCVVLLFLVTKNRMIENITMCFTILVSLSDDKKV